MAEKLCPFLWFQPFQVVFASVACKANFAVPAQEGARGGEQANGGNAGSRETVANALRQFSGGFVVGVDGFNQRLGVVKDDEGAALAQAAHNLPLDVVEVGAVGEGEAQKTRKGIEEDGARWQVLQRDGPDAAGPGVGEPLDRLMRQRRLALPAAAMNGDQALATVAGKVAA